MPLRLSIVTAEREVSSRDDVQRLIVPTTEGQITLLPGHAALMASLDIGELVTVAGGDREPMVVHGGFIQILRDEVTPTPLRAWTRSTRSARRPRAPVPPSSSRAA